VDSIGILLDMLKQYQWEVHGTATVQRGIVMTAHTMMRIQGSHGYRGM